MPTKNYLITPVLVLLNLIVFVLMAVNGVHIMEPDSESLLQWGANFRPLTAEGEYWRLLSSCFVHIGIFHLLMNMYALLYIGPLLEPYLGKTRFLGAYLLTGIAASVTSLYWNDYTVSAGAFGAIFGMYGVFLAMLTTNVIEKSTRKPLLTSIAAFVGYNLLFGLKGGIDNAAHIGGLISGMVIGYCFYPSLVKPSIIRLKYTTVSLLAITILISSYLVVSAVQPGDMVTYEKEMAEFSILEEKALSIYNMPETASDQLILKKIKNTGIPSWEASLDLFERVEKLDLPDALAEQNILMKKYCELRLKSYELIYKAVSEGTDSYQEELDTYNAEIEAIINNLNATAL